MPDIWLTYFIYRIVANIKYILRWCTWQHSSLYMFLYIIWLYKFPSALNDCGIPLLAGKCNGSDIVIGIAAAAQIVLPVVWLWIYWHNNNNITSGTVFLKTTKYLAFHINYLIFKYILIKNISWFIYS